MVIDSAEKLDLVWDSNVQLSQLVCRTHYNNETTRFTPLNRAMLPISVFQGHGEGEVWGLATHAERHEAATASDDGCVRLWRYDDGRNVAIRTARFPEQQLRVIAYNSNGNIIVVGTKYG